ncbi:MAG: HAMP domain-containing protein [Desulfobacteraceae bacterium]|nr:HAMP domain-containing protein [Desulfobacteraceae bacterium]
MKIQYKAASIMTLLGVVIVILLSLYYDIYNHKIILDKEMNNIENISKVMASHIESHIKEKSLIAITLSSAPLIKNALLKSNSEFAALTDNDRKHQIDRQNRQWMETADINDPFIQNHMTNPVALYLKYQQIIIPGNYGEIFLTNRYGVMIATTGKLTTLAHAHKYWWIAGYDDGRGRIFLDDRGFDTSVEGYVIGVVIPIMDENKIIGILKCNVNIMGSLTDVIQEFSLNNPGRIKIVRTGGLIVSEPGVPPLSTQVGETLVELLRQKENGSTIIFESNANQLVAFSPIQITMGSEQFGFGGKQKSIDHIKGNKGEAWHVIVSLSEKKASKTAREITTTVVIVGILFTILTAIISLFLGKWLAKPIVELSTTAQIIGEGNLETRADVNSNDEIGSLAKSLNKMAKNLQNTMTSRDKLIHEIKLRKKTEDERESFIQKLEHALNEIKTLSGLLPICANCKKVRDDKGYWNQIESYIQQHSEAKFSHGMCPECADRLYGDQEWYIKMKEKKE